MHDSGMDRRRFLMHGAIAAGAAVAGLSATAGASGGGATRDGATQGNAAGTGAGGDAAQGIHASQPQAGFDAPFPELEEATIADLQSAMASGKFTSRDLVARYLARIEALNLSGPNLRAVIETNPQALDIAASLDAARRKRGSHGPLHGIPVLLKDNIDTADRMQTTAGSLALLTTRPAQDATVARRLREAGAVILGKANLSEWANIRSSRSISGWSGRGGQCRNPFVITHNPCGSSSGSAVAVSANLCVAALGTETDGSIVCPSHINGVVGIKPTVGLTSRAGVVPISHTQDTVGPHARTVRDAAILLGALIGEDPRDGATSGGLASGAGSTADARSARIDYMAALDPDGLRGARIGIPRKLFFGYSASADAVIEEAIRKLSAMGAVIVDSADIPTAADMASGADEITVLLYELKADLNAYLATRVAKRGEARGSAGADSAGPGVLTLADVIAFNDAHAKEEMPYFAQELFIEAQAKGPLTDPDYLKALETCRRLSRTEGIDAVMDANRLDALVAPTGNPAWPIDPVNGDHFIGASSQPAAMAGYPLITVPAGYAFGLPVGITFMGRAYSEPTLIRFAYAFEQATKARRAPRFLTGIELG
jgi:amidase